MAGLTILHSIFSLLRGDEMVNEEYYQYPTGIVYRTENVVDLYLDFPDLDSFYDYYGTITPTTINNIKNEYNIDKSVDVNI